MKLVDLASLGIKVPFLSTQSMRDRADGITRHLMKERPLWYWTKEGWSFDRVWPRVGTQLDGLQKIEGASLQLEYGTGHLGSYSAMTKTIHVDAEIAEGSEDPRRQFTLWHECSHHVQHHLILRQAEAAQQSLSPDTGLAYSEAEERAIEFQASFTGGHLAAPTVLLMPVLKSVIGPVSFPYRAGEVHWLLGTPLHPESLDEWSRLVAREIRHRFGGLSADALGRRLVEEEIVYPFGERRRVLTFRRSRPMPSKGVVGRGRGAVA